MSWSQNWNINSIIAAATKMEEESELEILVDDAGENGGMSTKSAITAMGAAILGCFICACCCIVACKK